MCVPPEREITVTAGATQAIYTAISTTRGGSVWSAADMAQLEAITRGTDIVVLADEVYEHIIFDGARHESAPRYAGLAERSFIVSSFGKTYHITGWKIGYVAAPQALTSQFRKAHQYLVFCVNHPAQLALADYMQDESRYLGLAVFYQAKRDSFRRELEGSAFDPLPYAGTCFQLAHYGRIGDEPDLAFCERLARPHGVAAIPVSAFYGDGRDDRVIRFCFAKGEATLKQAGERLRAITTA